MFYVLIFFAFVQILITRAVRLRIMLIMFEYFGLSPAMAFEFKSPVCFGLNGLILVFSISAQDYITFGLLPALAFDVKSPGHMLFKLCVGHAELYT